MKKLLSILGAVSMLSTAPSMVLSCNGGTDQKKDAKKSIKIGEQVGKLIAGTEGTATFDLTFSKGFEPKQEDLNVKFDNETTGLTIGLSVTDKKVTVKADKSSIIGRFEFTISDKTDVHINIKASVEVIEHSKDTFIIGEQKGILVYGKLGTVTFSVTPSKDFKPDIKDLSVNFDDPSKSVGLKISFTDTKTITVSGDTTTKQGSYSFTVTDEIDKYFTNAKGVVKVNNEQIIISDNNFELPHGYAVAPKITNWVDIKDRKIKLSIKGNSKIFVNSKLSIDSDGVINILTVGTKSITGKASIEITGENCDKATIEVSLVSSPELEHFNVSSDIAVTYNGKIVSKLIQNDNLNVVISGSLDEYNGSLALNVKTNQYDNFNVDPKITRFINTHKYKIAYLFSKDELKNYFNGSKTFKITLKADNVKNPLVINISFSKN